MLERRGAEARFGPAHRAVRRDARTLHRGDDLGAVGPLRGDAAIGKTRVEFARAIGNEPGGHGIEHCSDPLVMPALLAARQDPSPIMWRCRALSASLPKAVAQRRAPGILRHKDPLRPLEAAIAGAPGRFRRGGAPCSTTRPATTAGS